MTISTIGQFSIKFGTNLYGGQRMYPNDAGDSSSSNSTIRLTFAVFTEMSTGWIAMKFGVDKVQLLNNFHNFPFSITIRYKL